MKLYAARHGQTIWNAQNRICGRTDVELTEEGIQQAKILAAAVEKCAVDVILSSPLKRARDTSQIVAEHNRIPVLVEDRLTEQDYGIYEGVDGKNPAFLENKRQFAYRYPQGESMMLAACRVYGLLDQVKERYKGRNVLIISHGGVCRIIRTYFMDMTNEEFFRYTLGNGKIEEYEWPEYPGRAGEECRKP